MTGKRLAIAASLAAVAAVVLAACSSSGGGNNPSNSNTGTNTATGTSQGVQPAYGAAINAVVNPSTKTGGTLKLLASADCDSWDPKIAYYGWCWNMQRLYVRSLVGYKTLNGNKFVLAPDIATDMGQHNADFTQWTFTIKPGIKWQDGTPVTAQDVKYGLERNWASAELPGGPSSYFINGIKAPKDYKGPFKDGDLPDSDIKASGQTITINLVSPNADFDYLMAMGASAPIPKAHDTGATYTKKPFSDGPFEISSYSPGKAITFKRNPNWSQSTDTIHHPLVNEVDLTIDSNNDDIDAKLKSGDADANANGGAGGLTEAFKAAVLSDPNLKKNADDAPAAFTQYMPVFQTVIKNVHCRNAIFYATNKASLLSVYGGDTSGVIAKSMTPPGIPGYDPSFDPFPDGADSTGNIPAAKAELQKCGEPNGFNVNFAYSTPSSYAPKVYAAESQALARVGIKLSLKTADASSYYNTFIGSPSNVIKKQIGMALAGWGADFPTDVGFYQAIANGNAIFDPGTSNYVSLNDPVVNGILGKGPSGQATLTDWQNLNKQIMKDAVYVPIYWGKTMYYRNPRLTNVTCDNALAFGIYDFVNVGVTS